MAAALDEPLRVLALDACPDLPLGLPAMGIEQVAICTGHGGETADRLRRDGIAVEALSEDHRAVDIVVLLRR